MDPISRKNARKEAIPFLRSRQLELPGDLVALAEAGEAGDGVGAVEKLGEEGWQGIIEAVFDAQTGEEAVCAVFVEAVGEEDGVWQGAAAAKEGEGAGVDVELDGVLSALAEEVGGIGEVFVVGVPEWDVPLLLEFFGVFAGDAFSALRKGVVDVCPLRIAFDEAIGAAVAADLVEGGRIGVEVKLDEKVFEETDHFPVGGAAVGVGLHVPESVLDCAVVPGLLGGAGVEAVPESFADQGVVGGHAAQVGDLVSEHEHELAAVGVSEGVDGVLLARAPGEALVFAVAGDKAGDVFAEVFEQIGCCGIGVFEDVVQHAGGQERRVGVHAVQDEHGLQRMQDVRAVGAFAALTGVVLGSVGDGALEQLRFWCSCSFGPVQTDLQRLFA